MTDELLLRKTALKRGVTDYALRQACQSGRLTRLRPGAYAYTNGPADPYGRHLLAIRATADAVGDGVAISHQSAAVLHGLPLLEPPGRQVHATVNRATGGRLTRCLHLHSTRFDEDEVMMVDGVLTTTPARTVADLARTASFCGAVVTGDAAMRTYGLSIDQLTEALQRWHRRRGLSQARQAIFFMDARSESPGESRSRVAMHFAFLPKPELQTEIRDEHGDFVARVDFFLPQHNVIGDFAFPGDSTDVGDLREDVLRGLGAQVVRWTTADLDDFTATASRWRRAIARSATAPPPRWQIR
ncbi:type IV toxin-antitoxin system AbiEi family antitoxin domain-containing protein [Nocardia sp. XZ_19_385]|uniref:type IV toxin-antitoxin system AbiEi family antitoxin domain-containing protein n=1 Tax=Nocardia sp. XZ_19_385 TaxID=2769488 RepID=UPI0018901D5E|nr:type IV toxin-antitoxin system AbiEi family antitoxin domain-containing protein [Nocardia sp. XZ_19_385]